MGAGVAVAWRVRGLGGGKYDGWMGVGVKWAGIDGLGIMPIKLLRTYSYLLLGIPGDILPCLLSSIISFSFSLLPRRLASRGQVLDRGKGMSARCLWSVDADYILR